MESFSACLVGSTSAGAIIFAIVQISTERWGISRTPRVDHVPKSVRQHLGDEASGARGPGGHSRVATTARIVPPTGERIAILAERAFVVRRGVPLTHPDGERVIFDLVGVVQRLAFREAEVARPDVRAGILTVPVLVTDDLQTLGAAEVDMLQHKEPAFGPLVDDGSLCFAGHSPRADQPVQAREVRMGLRRLPLRKVRAVGHDLSPLRRKSPPQRRPSLRFCSCWLTIQIGWTSYEGPAILFLPEHRADGSPN